MRFMLILAIFGTIAGHTSADQQTQKDQPPSYVACMKALHTLDDYSLQVLGPGCLTVIERYCLAPARAEVATSCFDTAAKEMKEYRLHVEKMLPAQAGDDVSIFRRKGFNSSRDRLAKGTAPLTCPEGLPVSACSFFLEITVASDLFRAAQIVGLELP